MPRSDSFHPVKREAFKRGYTLREVAESIDWTHAAIRNSIRDRRFPAKRRAAIAELFDMPEATLFPEAAEPAGTGPAGTGQR